MLTNAECDSAKCPPDKKKKSFSDGGGLYLEVAPINVRSKLKPTKRWFFKYRKQGAGDKAGRLVQTRIALGSYPTVSLAQARKARDDAKATKAQGLDPVQARKVDKLKAANPSADTFKAVALEWYELNKSNWSASYCTRNRRNLEKDLFPAVGVKRMADIHPMDRACPRFCVNG